MPATPVTPFTYDERDAIGLAIMHRPRVELVTIEATADGLAVEVTAPVAAARHAIADVVTAFGLSMVYGEIRPDLGWVTAVLMRAGAAANRPLVAIPLLTR